MYPTNENGFGDAYSWCEGRFLEFDQCFVP